MNLLLPLSPDSEAQLKALQEKQEALTRQYLAVAIQLERYFAVQIITKEQNGDITRETK